MKGKFIVLEGGEGAGKTTIAHALKKKLPALLVTHAWCTPLGAKLRAELIAEENKKMSSQTQFALAFAAHSDQANALVAPALSKGISVISDRFDASTFAYQVYAQKAVSPELFFAAREALLSCKPDIYIFLDVAPEVGLSRLRKTGKSMDHIERRGEAFHALVREGYREFFKTVPSVTIDAGRSIDAVEREVLALVSERLKA